MPASTRWETGQGRPPGPQAQASTLLAAGLDASSSPPSSGSARLILPIC